MWGDVQHRLGIEVDLEGSKMTPPDRLADTLKAISAVRDLTKSPVISPNANSRSQLLAGFVHSRSSGMPGVRN